MKRIERKLLVGFLLVLWPGLSPGPVPLLGQASVPPEASAAPAPVAAPAPAAAAAPVAAKARAPKPKSRAADAARVLRRINPDLSEPEALRIGEAVVRHGARYGLDLELVLAVILVESGARPAVVSPAGALGLMQVMPAHFERLGFAGDGIHVDRNVEVGCRILASNIARHGEERGILAYYWGERIRGDAYLTKVRSAQEKVRARLSS